MSPASSSIRATCGHAVEALGGVVAEQLAGPVDVDLGERAGVGRAPQQVLELVHVAEALHQLGGLGHVERVGAGEVVAAVPAHLREQRPEVAAELVDLPAQVHVLEQLLGQLAQLLALGRRHRVEHRLQRRPCAGPSPRAARRGSAGSRGRSRRSAP